MWVDCVVDNDYEIYTEFPHQIRRKSTKRIIAENISHHGYVRVKLNLKDKFKHVIVAKQFIPNPHNYTEVDHLNHIRTDYRIENLMWVSRSANAKNKSVANGIRYEFISDLPEDAVGIYKHLGRLYRDYYFSGSEQKMYYYNGESYRVMFLCKDGAFSVRDVNRHKARIFLRNL